MISYYCQELSMISDRNSSAQDFAFTVKSITEMTKGRTVVTIHGALHLAARHPADKATVSGIQPLAEGDFSWAGCVTVRG
ncbi:MAG: hypothetical protein K2O13_10480, partial [Lachnospiraceae bacterium]|nr:hypothetical protein [Lachnospiraceae bacterium]